MRTIVSADFRFGYYIYKQAYLNRYVDTQLGRIWLVVMPCLPLVLYNFLQFLGVFPDSGETMPKAVFISIGISLYHSFTDALNGFTTALTRKRSHLITTSVTIRGIYISEIIEAVSIGIIRCIYLSVILVYFNLFSVVAILQVLIGILSCIIIGSVSGIVASIVCVFFRDISNVVSVFSFYFLFASGVFAEIKTDNPYLEKLTYSPVYIAIENTRRSILENLIFLPTNLVLILVASTILIFLIYLRIDKANKYIYDFI